MAFPPEFLRELEDRSRIEEIAESYVRLRRAGKNLVGLCPFHSEKTPSFNVYPGNNSFYCFGCGKGGGVINFVMDIERLDFLEAVKWLAQRAGMSMPEEGADDSMSKLRMRILEINRESGRFFYKTLISPEGEPGLSYFKGRGLDPGTIKHFGLGYAPESGFGLVNHLRKLGYTKEELLQSDMVRTSKKGNLYDRYRGRVMAHTYRREAQVHKYLRHAGVPQEQRAFRHEPGEELRKPAAYPGRGVYGRDSSAQGGVHKRNSLPGHVPDGGAGQDNEALRR